MALSEKQLAEAEVNADAQVLNPYWHGTIKALTAEVRALRAAISSAGEERDQARLEVQNAYRLQEELQRCAAAVDAELEALRDDFAALNSHVAEAQALLLRHGYECGADGSLLVGIGRLIEKAGTA